MVNQFVNLLEGGFLVNTSNRAWYLLNFILVYSLYCTFVSFPLDRYFLKLFSFAHRCRLLTVENEHMDVVTLEKLVQQGIDCQIKVSTIMIIQVSLAFYVVVY